MLTTTIASSILTSLSICQNAVEDLKFDIDAQKIIQLCQTELEKTPVTIDETYKLPMTSHQKTSLLKLSEEVLQEIDDAMQILLSVDQKKFEEKSVSLSSLVALENRLLMLTELLRSQETWHFENALGTGLIRFGDTKYFSTFKVSSQFFFDAGKTWEGSVKINSNTPIREENDYVTLPLREADAMQLSQAWLRHKFFSRVKMQFGFFPDEFFSAPQQWPFLSTQAHIDFLKNKGFSLNVLFRHDRREAYVADYNKPRGIPLERTLTQATFRYTGRMQKLKVASEFAGRLHWYGDPERQLATLGLGKPRYYQREIARGNMQYRVVEWSAQLGVQAKNFGVTQNMTYLRNMMERPVPEGWIAQTKLSYISQEDPKHWIAYSTQKLACGSTPSIQLGSYWMPGLSLHRLGIGSQLYSQNQMSLKLNADFELSSQPTNDESCGSGGSAYAMEQRTVTSANIEFNYVFDNFFNK